MEDFDIDENVFCSYSEWANDELVWGKGRYNWCRDFKSRETCMKDFDDNIEIPF